MNETLTLEQKKVLELNISYLNNRFEIKSNLLIKQDYIIGLLINVINFVDSTKHEVFRALNNNQKINTIADVLGNLEDVELGIYISKDIYLATLENMSINIGVNRDVRSFIFIAALEKLKYKLITSSVNHILPNVILTF